MDNDGVGRVKDVFVYSKAIRCELGGRETMLVKDPHLVDDGRLSRLSRTWRTRRESVSACGVDRRKGSDPPRMSILHSPLAFRLSSSSMLSISLERFLPARSVWDTQPCIVHVFDL
jgi:hypothetical protein